jgi:hypothetical protein
VYSSEVGLFDSFELRGKWWLPNAPEDRVHGTLSYLPAQRIELRLDGKFQDPKLQNIFLLEPFKAECILGETVEEEFVTLYRVFASRVSRTDTFIADALLTGERFSSASDLSISGALLDYTNLEEWASIRLLKAEEGATADSYRVAIPVSAINLFKVQDAGPFKKLELMAGVQSSFVGGNFSAQLRTFFDCDFQTPVSLRDAEGILYKMGNFLSVLQGETTYVKKVRVRVFRSNDSCRTANWFRTPRVKEPPILFSYDMNLSLRELGTENATCLFSEWFTNATLLDSVYDLLVGTYGRQSERTKFRALAQALEAFHRAVQGGVYLSKESYEPIRKGLCAAIPAGLEPDFQERLKGSIKHGYQYSLRTRLKALLGKLNNRTKEAVMREKTSTFINLVISVRNYLTHFDETEKPAIVKDAQGMYNLNQRLRALLIVLLLAFLGVPEDKVTDGVVSHLNLAR